MRTLLTLALVFAPSAVLAQSNCTDRKDLVQRLSTGYGEVFTGGGLQNRSRIIEVWASDEKGTWTILVTRADGTSCVMASGTYWRDALPTEQLSGVPG